MSVTGHQSSRRFPPRLHVLLAREARTGLVIRRGPSQQVCTILWNRRDDTFEVGQWLRGRIYERRSDLTPDGKYFIYFAMNGRWQSAVKGSWTAVSKTPYLKAITLLSKGDCWNGGGLFTGKRSYWLNDGCGHSEMKKTREVTRDAKYRPQNFGGECLSVYYPRLLRDGWELVHMGRQNQLNDFEIFEKPLTRGWVLRKLAHSDIKAPQGKGCYWDEHELFHPESGKLFKYPNWEWADVDGTRLTWTSNGKLCTARLTAQGLVDERELFDFSDLTFERIEAPY